MRAPPTTSEGGGCGVWMGLLAVLCEGPSHHKRRWGALVHHMQRWGAWIHHTLRWGAWGMDGRGRHLNPERLCNGAIPLSPTPALRSPLLFHTDTDTHTHTHTRTHSHAHTHTRTHTHTHSHTRTHTHAHARAACPSCPWDPRSWRARCWPSKGGRWQWSPGECARACGRVHASACVCELPAPPMPPIYICWPACAGWERACACACCR